MNIPEKLLFSSLKRKSPTKTGVSLLKYMFTDFMPGEKKKKKGVVL